MEPKAEQRDRPAGPLCCISAPLAINHNTIRHRCVREVTSPGWRNRILSCNNAL